MDSFDVKEAVLSPLKYISMKSLPLICAIFLLYFSRMIRTFLPFQSQEIYTLMLILRSISYG